MAPVATQDRIIDAAMELLSEHGYRGTRIIRIEEAAGLIFASRCSRGWW